LTGRVPDELELKTNAVLATVVLPSWDGVAAVAVAEEAASEAVEDKKFIKYF